MDVRCTRCGTEYEFDDALISERGTSVRCTQCGHQFRVFSPQTKVLGPDEWVVLTSLGRRVVYRSLRELQNGISRGEVAREDLLARGTAPPRPLGAIAELDPLFSVKATPERKSSTLTGVAPPPKTSTPKGAEAKGAEAPTADVDNANPLRVHHDTWSGVAPQAKVKALEELSAMPSPPMRVGGSTVLGIGTPPATATRQSVAKMPAPEVGQVSAREDQGSLPPETRSFEEGSIFTTEATAGDEAALTVKATPAAISSAQVVGAEVVKPSARLDVADSEPPTLPPPASKPETTRSEEPKPETTRSEEPKPREVPGASEPTTASPRSAPTSRPSRAVTEVSRPTSPTRPPSRPRHGKAQPVAATSRPWGVIIFSVLLLGGGLYAGMQLMGIKLDQGVRHPVRPVTAPSPLVSVTRGGEAVLAVAPWPAIQEVLDAGDSEAAERLLGNVTGSVSDSSDYRRLRILTDAMAVDMLWWQKRLLPKTDTSQIESLTTTLSQRLSALQGLLEICRVEEDCKAQTMSAYWALRRMQGQVELAQAPKQGTVDATGLYQLAMLDWAAAGKPEVKTLERLTKARLPGVEQGPRVTALIVALIDSKRFDDARAELAKLSSATKAHPHLEALNRYLRLADEGTVQDGGVVDATANDADDLDQDLREPDFRIRLQKAAVSLSRNEVTKAQKLYRSVLAQRPNDTEAITGYADILRRRGDLVLARQQYERALALNNNYLPAMAGSAGARWQSGDRAGAVALYRRIVERVGEGPGYGQQAAARIKEFEGGKVENAAQPTPANDKAPSDGSSTKAGASPASDAPRKAP